MIPLVVIGLGLFVGYKWYASQRASTNSLPPVTKPFLGQCPNGYKQDLKTWPDGMCHKT